VSRHNKGKRRRRPRSTAPQVPPRPPRGIERIEARPKAPWHPFPLVEICVLIGIVCIAIGFFSRDSTLGRTILALGFVLGALGGLDTSAREHWAGFRSHTLVLAAFPAVAVAILSALANVPNFVLPIILLGIFLAAFIALRRVWERATPILPPRGG
jgi:disulfide bond formation protein DsbB